MVERHRIERLSAGEILSVVAVETVLLYDRPLSLMAALLCPQGCADADQGDQTEDRSADFELGRDRFTPGWSRADAARINFPLSSPAVVLSRI
jgi:hypothetical protein